MKTALIRTQKTSFILPIVGETTAGFICKIKALPAINENTGQVATNQESNPDATEWFPYNSKNSSASLIV